VGSWAISPEIQGLNLKIFQHPRYFLQFHRSICEQFPIFQASRVKLWLFHSREFAPHQAQGNKRQTKSYTVSDILSKTNTSSTTEIKNN
jgi:hypothetical protein